MAQPVIRAQESTEVKSRWVINAEVKRPLESYEYALDRREKALSSAKRWDVEHTAGEPGPNKAMPEV